MKKTITGAAFTLFAALTSTTVLAAPDEQKLEKQMYDLKQELDDLKKSKIFDLEFGGRIQADFNYFQGAYNAGKAGDPGSDFFPRRIRTYVESVHGDWDHKLLLDFADGGGEIVLARVRYKGFGNGLKVQAGKLWEEISLNGRTSSKHIATISRSSLANTMAPYFSWGASANQYFEDSGIRYAVGVYRNEAFGAVGQNVDANGVDNGVLALALTGRLTWQKDLQDGVLHLGGWYSNRDMGGRDLGARFARGEVRNTNTRLVEYVAGGSPVALNSLQQAGLEAAYQLKGLTVEAEYAARELNAVDPASPLDGEVYDGYTVTASYFPAGLRKQYSKGSAVFKQPKGVRDAWELVARLSNMDATSDTQGTETTSYTLGTNYYYSSKVKFMANAIYSEVSGPGAASLVGNEDNGLGFTGRIQYLF